jgi:hypothetical protein
MSRVLLSCRLTQLLEKRTERDGPLRAFLPRLHGIGLRWSASLDLNGPGTQAKP